MKIANVVALLAALLLTAVEVLVMDYDARQRVALYQAEAASALAARG
jgi:cell division protein FtsL